MSSEDEFPTFCYFKASSLAPQSPPHFPSLVSSSWLLVPAAFLLFSLRLSGNLLPEGESYIFLCFTATDFLSVITEPANVAANGTFTGRGHWEPFL